MKTILFGTAFLALLGNLGAQTLTTMSQYGLPIAESTTEIDETGYLSFFDSNLGTLTGASLSLFGAGTTYLTLTNTSPSTVTIRATVSSDLFFSSGLSPLDDFLQSKNAGFTLLFPTGPQTFTSGQVRTFGPMLSSTSVTYDLAPLLASLQSPGGGNFSINGVSMNGLTIVGGGGNIASSQVTTAGTGAKIIYSYLPIPEPSSALLVIASALPLFARRRRR